MELKNIIMLVVIVILVIIVIRYIRSDVNTLTNVVSATSMQTIEAADLDTGTSTSSSSNFTYSIWFNIDDWNYRYGEPKVIFGRMTSGTGSKEPCPSVVLGGIENNIAVSLAVYPGQDTIPENGTNYIIHTCAVANIPIQKWVNLFISVYGRSLDIYIDGKLVRTCVLPGVANIDTTAPVYVTPNGGFSGWTAKLQYWSDASDPQKAWNIYKAGYGGSFLGNIFGKYTVKISLMEGDTEDGSISI